MDCSMKNIVYLFLAFSLCYSTKGQDLASLQQRAQKLYLHIVENKGDSIINYAHPSVFKTITQKEFIEAHNNSGTVEGIKVSVLNIPPNFKINDIKKIGQNSYCILYYDEAGKITFIEPVPSSSEKHLINIAKVKMNAEKVVFNSYSNSLLIKRRLKLIAAADSSTNYVWMFYPVLDKATKELLGL